MTKLDTHLFDIGHLDTLAAGNSALHRMDPRAKLITTLVFIGTVLSYGKYDIAALMPFALYPLVLTAWGGLPGRYLIRKIILVSPFAIFVGIFNPLLDQTVISYLGPLPVTGGMVSFMSIMVRFVLTVSAALVLISLTGFHTVCMGLEKLGVPRPFVVQLLFLYRYIFVLMDEGGRMVRARALRSFNGKGRGLRIFSSMIGHLLLRTLDRAQRIHLAMCCRGFDGHIRMIHPMAFRTREAAFVLGWSALFITLRLNNIPQFLGKLITEFLA